MRVAMVSTWETLCGIAGYTGSLRQGLLRAGVECDVVPIDRVATKYMSRPELQAYFSGLADQAEPYDVAHIQVEYGFFAGAYNYAIAYTMLRRMIARLRAQGKPVFVTFHSDPVSGLGISNLNERAPKAVLHGMFRLGLAPLFRPGRRTWAIAHTRTSRLALIRVGMPAESIHVLHQGVPVGGAGAGNGRTSAAARRALGLPEDAVGLAMFGFLARYKGYRTALRALRQLPGTYHLLIAGTSHPLDNDPAHEDILDYLRRNPALVPRVHLLGYVDQERLSLAFDAVDIFLAPYLPKPTLSSSAALSSALASGKPVIASKIPAFVELNEDADCLHLVAPEAPQALAHAIEAVAADDALRNRLVSNARLHARASSWEKSALRHLELYDAALGRASGRHADSDGRAAAQATDGVA